MPAQFVAGISGSACSALEGSAMTYKVLGELGRGGFGVVELVQNEEGERFARKTLQIPHHLDKKQVTARFEREVKYQSALHHENVVEIIDFELAAAPPWFVMRLAKCSLLHELTQDRTLGGDPKTALFDILAGLEEIHRRGYLHRDLKPGNVLKFDGAMGGVHYALSDFGLMAIGEDASSTLTISGMGGGTPAYQAPECAINFKRATIRSDIYSFGAILHDIFATNSQRLPHDELTVPGDVGPIVEKCTKRLPLR
jgi:serine/threonine protein kinase